MPRKFLHQSFLSSANNMTPSAVRCWVSSRNYNVRINSCNSELVLHNHIDDGNEIIFKLRNLKKACDESIKAIQIDQYQRKVKVQRAKEMEKLKNTEGL